MNVPEQTYKAQIMCGNCEECYWVDIPRGIPKRKFIPPLGCVNCGVTNWHWLMTAQDHHPIGD